ncbi:MAG: hypothetical protein WC809_19710 [Sinimarinibacterium sp.]|jgi:hypothetical protein
MLLSASDAVLALASVYALMRLRRLHVPGCIRWAAQVGIALIGLAAAVGALRFGGLQSLGEVHQLLSDQSAIVAIPMLAIAVFARHNGSSSPLRGFWRVSVLYVLFGLFLVDILLQQRALAALLSVATLAMVIGCQPRQSKWPTLLVAGLLAAGGVRSWNALPLEPRLIGLHLILAIWLAIYIHALEGAADAGQPVQPSTG